MNNYFVPGDEVAQHSLRQKRSALIWPWDLRGKRLLRWRIIWGTFDINSWEFFPSLNIIYISIVLGLIMTAVNRGTDLIEKMKCRQAVVSVLGIGYVGLPLAVAFAETGFQVIGIDTDEGKVEAVNRGESYLMDVASDRLLPLTKAGRPKSGGKSLTEHSPRAGELRGTTDFGSISRSDVVIVCVPTPLSKTKDPDLTYVVAAVDEIAKRLNPGMLVVMESTTYPGATEELVLPRLENANGRMHTVGEDFYLAFSPERIDPGNADWTVDLTPKVVGGVTQQCLSMATNLYSNIVKTVVPVSSTKVAEMVKLLENTFRATNIALVNEVAIMCDLLGVDVWEVIEAAKTKPFGFMPFYPGPGLGGHCIPIDPQYLAWKLKTLDYDARFIQLAAEINFGMPAYVVDRIGNALKEDGKKLEGSRVLILGVTYKADVADLRESPALDIIHLLREKGTEVAYHDPYVPQLSIDDISMERITLELDSLRQADCVVITAAHKDYDWTWIVENSQLVVDTRNATNGINARSGRVVKL